MVEFAGGVASHFKIFLRSLQVGYLPSFDDKCTNFPKLCAALVVFSRGLLDFYNLIVIDVTDNKLRFWRCPLLMMPIAITRTK